MTPTPGCCVQPPGEDVRKGARVTSSANPQRYVVGTRPVSSRYMPFPPRENKHMECHSWTSDKTHTGLDEREMTTVGNGLDLHE